MDPLYKIRPAAADDAGAIRAIRNDIIEHSTAMWTTKLLTPEDGKAWMEENLARRSVYVAETSGTVIGFANWSPWRPKDGYRHTLEDSVYLVAGHQGRGVGTELLRTLIAGATESGAHVMMASIEATNETSVALHARQGFEVVGIAREVGNKFGRWLDLTMMRLAL
jgi:L-amino acid N-acyltransferase